MKILRYLNGLPGCHAEKVHVGMYGKRGTPDILGVYRGRALAFEVKRPGEKPTPLQAYVLDLWAGAGAIAGVVDGVEAVKRYLGCDLDESGEGGERKAG